MKDFESRLNVKDTESRSNMKDAESRSNVKDSESGSDATVIGYMSNHENNRNRAKFKGHGNWIFTSYFTSNRDPQRFIQRKADDWEYLEKWFNSIRLLGLDGVVFHDGMSEEFIRKATEFYPNVVFEYVNIQSRSTNDARFYAYLNYLQTNPHIQRIICTDVSDVVFKRNPFDFMLLLGQHLYVGEDMDSTPRVGENHWVLSVFAHCKMKNSLPLFDRVRRYFYLYNAGVIGGDRVVMLNFLSRVTAVLDGTPETKNCNMAAVNYVIHAFFDDIVFTGYPLTNYFKEEREDHPLVYIVHRG